MRNGLGRRLLPEAVRTSVSPYFRIPVSPRYSTVTDFARFRGWSTFSPRFAAM